jgi:hypothetical protein
MKRNIIILLVGLLITTSAIAQENEAAINIAMKNDFKEMSKYTSQQGGFEGFQNYSSNTVKGSQFFYPNWVTGAVVTESYKEAISNKYLFIFDRVRQELFIKLRDSNVVLLADKTQIVSFTLNTDKPHEFVPDTKYNKSATTINFYEVIEKKETGYSFFKFVNTKFVKADPNDMMKVKNGDMGDEFVDNTSYYLYSQATGLNKISFNEKNILRAVETLKKAEAKKFFTEHSSDKIDETLVIDLVKKLNKS